jgi:hypothetical protein
MKLRLFENRREEVIGKPGTRENIKAAMQRIFTSEDGRRLLRYILFDTGFFSVCDTPTKQATRNWAAKFLNELGNVFDIEVSAEIVVRDGEENT